MNPYKYGPGLYLAWDKIGLSLRLFRVVREVDLVVQIPGKDYKPYVGAMNCVWLLKLRGEG